MDISAIPPFTRAQCPHCGEESRVKTQMDRFKLTDRLGIGGMSYVFVGRDEDLDRDVAVKILNEEYQTDPERTKQFEMEAKITASISHPNIVRVFTVGEDVGRLFIAMELVEGDSLEAIIRRCGAVDERSVLQIGIEVVEGLKAAATEGLIHRDIKPGNILVDNQLRARIVDFGLALLADEDNETKEIWATPYYVPPETLEGGDEDFRSDMYALGATLYHALAGRPPCPDDSLSIEKLKIAKTEIEDLGQANPQLNTATIEVVNVAMAHSPANRFESYDLMLESLKLAVHSLSTGEEVTISRRRQQSRKGNFRAARRKKMILGGVAASLVILCVGLWLGIRFSKDPAGNADDSTKVEITPRIAPPEEGATAQAGAQISALYQESRELIEEGNYSDGAVRLRELMEAPDVPLTTLSWAAIEAAACYFQDGKSGAAREVLLDFRRDLEQSGAALEGTAATADGLAGRILQLPSIDPKTLPSNPQGIEKLGYFVAGLKNWEQGRREQAVVLLRRFSDIPLTDATGALSVYQKRAKAYLRDARRLDQAQPNLDSTSLAELAMQREKIDEIYLQLETRGRAKLQTREWNLSLARRQRDLREGKIANENIEEVVENPFGEGVDQWTKIKRLTEQWEFNQALNELKKIDGAEQQRKDANFYLLETALNFKYNLINVFIETKPVLRNRAGDELGTFKGLNENAIELTDGDRVVTVAWPELSVDQLDEIFLAAAKAGTSEFQRELRYEQLIVFHYLVGIRDRGILAAARLENSAFKKRWSKAREFSQFER